MTAPPAFQFVRDDAKRRLYVTALRPYVAADVIAVFDRQLAEGAWTFDMLYDLRRIPSATTAAEARLASAALRSYVAAHGRRGRVALVTRDANIIGVAQVYAYDSTAVGVDVQVFWDIGDAEEWLDHAG